MTFLSQYLNMERIDTAEEVTFYIPGAATWDDPRAKFLATRRSKAQIEHVYPTPDSDNETEEF